MSITNIIEVKFNGNQMVFVDSEYRLNSGMSLKFTDIDLPEAYQVHFANSLHGATFEAIGNADGVRIPDDVWISKDPIFAWIYLHPTEDSAVTKYEARIIKKIRADLPNGVEPTPYEQTVIDEAISALNTAVAQTAQDVLDADASAQSASASASSAAQSAEFLHNASASATTLEVGSDATVTLNDGQFEFGIPKGKDAINIVFDSNAILLNVDSNGRIPANTTIDVVFRVYDGDEIVVPTSAQCTALPNVRTYSYIKGTVNTISYEYVANTLISTTSGVVTVTVVYDGKTYTRDIPYTVVKSAANAVSVFIGRDAILIHVPYNRILTSALTINIPVRVYDGTVLKAASISAQTFTASRFIDDHTIEPIFIEPNITTGTEGAVSYTLPAGCMPDNRNAPVNITVTYNGISYIKSVSYVLVRDGADCCTYEDTGDGDIVITQTTI